MCIIYQRNSGNITVGVFKDNVDFVSQNAKP